MCVSLYDRCSLLNQLALWTHNKWAWGFLHFFTYNFMYLVTSYFLFSHNIFFLPLKPYLLGFKVEYVTFLIKFVMFFRNSREEKAYINTVCWILGLVSSFLKTGYWVLSSIEVYEERGACCKVARRGGGGAGASCKISLRLESDGGRLGKIWCLWDVTMWFGV